MTTLFHTDFEVSIRQIIRERLNLSDEPDPKVIVEALLQELVKSKRYDLLIEAAREGLKDLAWHLIRNDVAHRPETEQGHSRWAAHAATVGEHFDVFASRIHTGSEAKFLGDCTKTDLEGAARVKRTQAEGMLENADRLDTLARKLRKGQVVRDLDRLVVEKALDV